ncbi:ribosome recycling factor [Clostridium formicaceticum]|uniref:Ribosome-recycling factor n=1 Tax=Clostridium formicaceticum TaxID=1497 RepID=A0AAC9RLM9_9CLOT|nr:ribosome recycling factor [Clostridium formicaceticum]AOY77286.1 ribosome recycling factor [Clostridium formicaceticum]ARE87827.1 Ribosome-recycling factor [Clostridium formicaceticum]
MKLETHKNLEEKMNKTLKVLKEDLNAIRAGRANPSMLDRLSIDYYGTATPIKQIASVAAPEPRLITIQPYDPSVMGTIEKAIQQSDLGINPSNDGKVIRLNIPQLTEERRKDLTKIVKKTAEDSKVAIRNERRNANDDLKKMHKDGELTEDDLKAAQDEVQKITDQFIKKIDELAEAKEKEILEV